MKSSTNWFDFWPLFSTNNKFILRLVSWDFLIVPFYTYILYSAKLDRYYIGSCEDLDLRIQQHNTGRNKSTKPGIPWVIKYTESFESRSNATKREMEIKNKKNRKYIEFLIDSVG